MSLVEHAKHELDRIGEEPELRDHLLAVIGKFAEYGHSGGTAAICIERLEKLLRFRPLSPLTSDPNEWIDRTEMTGRPFWQNARDSRAFSEDGGKTWRLFDESPKPPAAAIIEILEPNHGTDDTTGGSVIVPTEVRINGHPVLIPEGQSITVHEQVFGENPRGHRQEDATRVTLTLFARRVVIAAEDDLAQAKLSSTMAD